MIIHLSTLRPFLSTWNVTWKTFFLIKTIHRDHNPRNGNHQYFEHNFPKNVTILEGDKHILLTNFYKLDVLYVTQHTFSKLPLNFENYTCIIVKMNGTEIKHKT